MYHGDAPQELTISAALATSPSKSLTVSIERARAQAQQAYLLYSGSEEKHELIHDSRSVFDLYGIYIRTIEVR